MVIRDEVEGFALFLKLDGGPHHPEVVTDVKRTRWLDT
jgi:hypothetical protein